MNIRPASGPSVAKTAASDSPATTEAPEHRPVESESNDPSDAKPAAERGAGGVEDSVGRMRVEQLYAQRIENPTIRDLETAKVVTEKLVTSIYRGDSASAELEKLTAHVGTILENAEPQSPHDLKLFGSMVESMRDSLERLEKHPPTGDPFTPADSRRISEDAAVAREALGEHVQAMAKRFRDGG